MENIFEQKKLAYEEEPKCSRDDVPQESMIEKKLRKLILKQRYINLGTFLKQQQEKYGIEEQDIRELKYLLFKHNDLKEINFIGTDMYANALFLKHKVPYLYRSVGMDTKEDSIFGDADIEYIDHTKEIFRECLKQIETGGKGNLFSYSKCFGKMLYKYATLQEDNSTIVIEVRKDAIVNAISGNGKYFISIQRYMREGVVQNEKNSFYFAIDMSNARDNNVECLKYWITEFLGKQKWHRHKDIVDPIGDAEVVCNFTNKPKTQCENTEDDDGVQRFEFNQAEFCVLLYKYFSEYAAVKRDEAWFNQFIDNTLKTLEKDHNKLKRYYKNIIFISNSLQDINFDNIKIKNIEEEFIDINIKNIEEEFVDIKNKNIEEEFVDINIKNIKGILNMIDWKNEIKYMSRRKGEVQEQKREPTHMEVYKGDNAEEVSKQWKYILFSAIEKKYLYIDYSNWK